jgi:hypothetical protein
MDVKVENQNKELKRLGFVKIAAIHTYVFVSYLYESAKKNSGSLRSAVETVEGSVTTVIGPVYNKFKGVPDDVLVFVDNKVVIASFCLLDSISALFHYLFVFVNLSDFTCFVSLL